MYTQIIKANLLLIIYSGKGNMDRFDLVILRKEHGKWLVLMELTTRTCPSHRCLPYYVASRKKPLPRIIQMPIILKLNWFQRSCAYKALHNWIIYRQYHVSSAARLVVISLRSSYDY